MRSFKDVEYRDEIPWAKGIQLLNLQTREVAKLASEVQDAAKTWNPLQTIATWHGKWATDFFEFDPDTWSWLQQTVLGYEE